MFDIFVIENLTYIYTLLFVIFCAYISFRV